MFVGIHTIFHLFCNYYNLTSCIENSVDPDQLKEPADQDLHCLQERYLHGSILFSRYKLICTIRQVKFSLGKYGNLLVPGQAENFTISTPLLMVNNQIQITIN